LTNKAVSLWELAAEFDPESVDFLPSTITALRRSGRHQRALAAADTLIRARPLSVQAYLAKGLTLYELGRFTEARDCFIEALRNQEHEEHGLLQDLNVFTNLGHVERMLGNHKAAKERYETRITLGVQKSDGLAAATHIKGSQKLADRQRHLLRHVRVCLAYTHLRLGGPDNKKQAKHLLEEVLAADPSYHQAAAGLFLIQPARRDLLESGLRACNERMNKALDDLSYPFHRAELELLKGDLSDQKMLALFIQAARRCAAARGFVEESIWFIELARRYLKDQVAERARDVIEELRKWPGSEITFRNQSTQQL
jgi:tetratricopeptide (TPR) repeat protein